MWPLVGTLAAFAWDLFSAAEPDLQGRVTFYWGNAASRAAGGASGDPCTLYSVDTVDSECDFGLGRGHNFVWNCFCNI